MPEHIVPKKIYFMICGILLALTLTTYSVALINLGRWNVVVGFGHVSGRRGRSKVLDSGAGRADDDMVRVGSFEVR